MGKELKRHWRVRTVGMSVYFPAAQNAGEYPEIIDGHPYFAVRFFEKGARKVCAITPLSCLDKAALAGGYSFLFALSSPMRDRICEAFFNIDTARELEDDFGGAGQLSSIKALAWDNCFAARELVEAEVRLLLVRLARKLCENTGGLCDTNDVRLSVLDSFFTTSVRNSNCSKVELADKLGVSERQLTRILNEQYGKNYHQLVLESRMGYAKILLDKGKSIEDTMRLSGYVSRRTFERAYKKFFGTSLIK